MEHPFSREALLIGEENIRRLAACRVAVFGAGGVGGYAIEALARSGIGAIDIVDGDKVSLTNLNRQILALQSTLGQWKAEVARERVLQINPQAQVQAFSLFFTEETAGQFQFSQYDYVVDAVDMVSAKLEMIRLSKEAGTPVITCMGTGNKFDPGAFRVTDISKTEVCPLARVMRRELKKRQVTGVKALWSAELPKTPWGAPAGERPVPGSMAFVPGAAGLLLAAEVVKDLLGGWPE